MLGSKCGGGVHFLVRRSENLHVWSQRLHHKCSTLDNIAKIGLPWMCKSGKWSFDVRTPCYQQVLLRTLSLAPYSYHCLRQSFYPCTCRRLFHPGLLSLPESDSLVSSIPGQTGLSHPVGFTFFLCTVDIYIFVCSISFYIVLPFGSNTHLSFKTLPSLSRFTFTPITTIKDFILYQTLHSIHNGIC